MKNRYHPHFITQASKFICEVFKPLQNKISLVNFMHDITFGKGQISMLVSHPEVFTFYHKNKIPMLCSDDSGRTLASGIYLNKILEKNHKDCSVLMPLMIKIGRQFGQSFGKNSLHIVIRENDCQHLYSLFFDLSENDFLHWVINNGNFLQDLIADYNISAEDFVLEAKSPENRIILPSYNESNSFVGNSNQKKLFHKTTNLPITLSKQQRLCLLQLSKGTSTKEIAFQMKLSPRTVEHYFARIRKQLGCYSNMELLATYYDQLEAYFEYDKI